MLSVRVSERTCLGAALGFLGDLSGLGLTTENPKPLNPKPLNPKPLNPKPKPRNPSPKPLNPRPYGLNPAPWSPKLQGMVAWLLLGQGLGFWL